jgi:cytidine deaminase
MTNKLFIFCMVTLFGVSTLGAVEDSQKKELVKKAAEARSQSYAPYSKFNVGAAILTKDGQIIQGANIENASYGLSVCAERIAVFKAISAGVKDIAAIAVVVPGGGTPCGACRQVLNEFNPNLPIYLGDVEGHMTAETSLKELLPNAFGPHNLQ